MTRSQVFHNITEGKNKNVSFRVLEGYKSSLNYDDYIKLNNYVSFSSMKSVCVH